VIPQQPLELRAVEAVAADHRTIQEQHRDVQAMAAAQLRVGVHVEDLNRWQRLLAPEALKFSEHLLAQLALASLHESQLRGGHATGGPGPRRRNPPPAPSPEWR
jgi:hypothetical protein